MFHDLIARLTNDQKRELHARGIPQPRLSDWKTGKRLPTRTQVLLLAEVTKADPLEIEKEVMLLETPAEQRQHLTDVLRRLGGAAACLFLVLGLVTAPEKANANQRLTTSHDATGNIHCGLFVG